MYERAYDSDEQNQDYYDDPVDFDRVRHVVETGYVTERDSARALFGQLPISPAMHSLERNSIAYYKTVKFMEKLKKYSTGRLPQWHFYSETVSSSDFPQLSANTLQWRLLELYSQVDFAWEQMVDINDTIPDFRSVKVTRIEGFDGPLPRVAEGSNYPMDVPTASDKTYNLAKFGKIAALTWEAQMNDFLRMFSKWPGWLARATRATENLAFNQQLASATGPNPLLFSTNGTTNGGITNMVTGATTGVLNEQNLINAYTAMTTRNVASGNPMSVNPKYLVVPSALRYTAEKLLAVPTLIPAVIATSGAQQFISNYNVLPGLGLTIVEDRWIGAVDVSANVNNTWYLLGDPGSGAAIEMGFLLGHRQPQIFRQAPGTDASPDDGDFDTDAMRWKCRHVLGGIALEPRFAYASVGA